VSPQHSNRQALLEGTLRCLERLPPERVTARAIADESGANLASIAYHFGSKDELVTAAVIEGLDRWLAEIEARLAGAPALGDRFGQAAAALDIGAHSALARHFVGALARAQHDPAVRERLAAGFARTRTAVADLLGLDEDAGALALAMFHGVLLQALLGSPLEGDRLRGALERFRRA
jgi:AcrR family transcriptional regulator